MCCIRVAKKPFLYWFDSWSLSFCFRTWFDYLTEIVPEIIKTRPSLVAACFWGFLQAHPAPNHNPSQNRIAHLYRLHPLWSFRPTLVLFRHCQGLSVQQLSSKVIHKGQGSKVTFIGINFFSFLFTKKLLKNVNLQCQNAQF